MTTILVYSYHTYSSLSSGAPCHRYFIKAAGQSQQLRCPKLLPELFYVARSLPSRYQNVTLPNTELDTTQLYERNLGHGSEDHMGQNMFA